MPLFTVPEVSMQKRLTWNIASLTFGTQDPVQGLGIGRKQGFRLWSLVNESLMQVLQAPHQAQTTFPSLLQAHLIETLANKTGLPLDLLAWMADFLFNHFPLLQEAPDFKVSPWA